MNRRQRLRVAHVLPSLDDGGTQRQLVALLGEMDHDRFRHLVVTLHEAGPLAARLPEAVACHPMNLPRVCRSAGLQLAGVLRRHGVDLVHARNTCTWLDATVATGLMPGRRLALGFHGFDAGATLTASQRRRAILARGAGARFTSVSRQGATILQNSANVPSSRITVLPNGIDLARFRVPEPQQRERARRALGYRAEDLVIGTVGALLPIKRHDLFIAAIANLARRHPHVRAIMAGAGPLFDELDGRIRSLGLQDRVSLVGAREDVEELLSAMDLYVCASDGEGVSNALLEAMATGLAVVTTDAGDHGTIVQEGVSGAVVATNSADAIMAACERLATDAAFRARVGRGARRIAESFDLAAAAAGYERFYAGVLGIREWAAFRSAWLAPVG